MLKFESFNNNSRVKLFNGVLVDMAFAVDMKKAAYTLSLWNGIRIWVKIDIR